MTQNGLYEIAKVWILTHCPLLIDFLRTCLWIFPHFAWKTQSATKPDFFLSICSAFLIRNCLLTVNTWILSKICFFKEDELLHLCEPWNYNSFGDSRFRVATIWLWVLRLWQQWNCETFDWRWKWISGNRESKLFSYFYLHDVFYFFWQIFTFSIHGWSLLANIDMTTKPSSGSIIVGVQSFPSL